MSSTGHHRLLIPFIPRVLPPSPHGGCFNFHDGHTRTLGDEEDSCDSMDSFYDFLSDCVAQWGPASPAHPMRPPITTHGRRTWVCLELIQAFESEEWEESEIEGEEDGGSRSTRLWLFNRPFAVIKKTFGLVKFCERLFYGH